MRVRTVCIAFCVSTPSDDQRGPCCCEDCWRKLAGTEDPLSHPSESTEDRPVQRLQVDGSIGALWESATDKFGFGAVKDGVKSGRRRAEGRENERSDKICRCQAADADVSRRTICLRTVKRTSLRTLCGQCARVECGYTDGNGGWRETETLSSWEQSCAQIHKSTTICGQESAQ